MACQLAGALAAAARRRGPAGLPGPGARAVSAAGGLRVGSSNYLKLRP
jgi:hypothetical protein